MREVRIAVLPGDGIGRQVMDVAWALFTVMTTWRTGRRILAERLSVRPSDHVLPAAA